MMEATASDNINNMWKYYKLVDAPYYILNEDNVVSNLSQTDAISYLNSYERFVDQHRDVVIIGVKTLEIGVSVMNALSELGVGKLFIHVNDGDNVSALIDDCISKSSQKIEYIVLHSVSPKYCDEYIDLL